MSKVPVVGLGKRLASSTKSGCYQCHEQMGRLTLDFLLDLIG